MDKWCNLLVLSMALAMMSLIGHAQCYPGNDFRAAGAYMGSSPVWGSGRGRNTPFDDFNHNNRYGFNSGYGHYGNDDNSIDEFLAGHNAARRQVGVPPLEWDNDVANFAQNYANQRSGDCNLWHSGVSDLGENIFVGTGDSSWTAAEAVKYWVDEGQYYDYYSNSCYSSDCGHYTQAVWKDTEKLGCARVVCDGGQGVFVTCNYSPPGNIDGQRPY